MAGLLPRGKGVIKNVDTSVKINLEEYRKLRKEGAPKAIPTICVLTTKKDKDFNPERAKSRIVALGNLEDCEWAKHKRYAPVLQYSSIRLMASLAIQRKRVIQQGDVKNAFCNADLPPDEVTIVRPPAGDPDVKPGEYWKLKSTLYGLRRSPKHWFDMLTQILTNMGLVYRELY